MNELVLKCSSCDGNEFKQHKFGIKCSYCGTVYKDKDLGKNNTINGHRI